MTSTDGISWKAQELFVSGLGDFAITTIGYGDGVFVGGKDYGGAALVFGDNGGTRWWYSTLGQSLLDLWGLYGIAYGNGHFVIAGADSRGEFGQGVILTSTPAFDWVRVNMWAALSAVAFGRDTFVSVGPVCVGWWCFLPQVVSSTNGTNWTYHDPRADTSLYGVAYGQGTFVAVGESGTILQSAKIGPRLDLLSTSGADAYAFNLIGDAGETYRIEASDDLANWTALTNFVSATGTNQFTEIAASNVTGRFYRAVTP
jgi:hypothetical protein